MTLGNKIADVFRDLPIVDFLDPKLKVQQTVVTDVKYDVNFAKVPIVDRCVSCHMGIEDPDFLEDIQPYATHPNLDLIGASSSPHPFNEFGCASCHSGRSRGTSFTSTVHMPHTKAEQEAWEEEHDWHIMHHWLQPMLPSEYSQAWCYKCHTEQPYLEGGDKLLAEKIAYQRPNAELQRKQAYAGLPDEARLLIQKDSSSGNTIDISLQHNGGRKLSNISRSKSRSIFGEMFSIGLQTIWPAKAGIWLPQ